MQTPAGRHARRAKARRARAQEQAIRAEQAEARQLSLLRALDDTEPAPGGMEEANEKSEQLKAAPRGHMQQRPRQEA
jgi:hypothetical protein